MLEGKTIVAMRSAETVHEFIEMIGSRGGRVICFPVIEIKDPHSWNECDAAIWRLANYDSVCFTSRNAVSKIVERIRLLRPQGVDILATRNIFAVGAKTKEFLESSGFQVTASPLHASAAELADTIISHRLAGTKILFPKSDIAGENLPGELRRMGAFVDEVVVYRTVLSDPGNRDQIKEMLTEGKVDMAVFFSPSGINNFLELIEIDLLSDVKIAAIGGTTAEAARKMGLQVALIPTQATSRGLAVAIINHFELQQPGNDR